MREELVQLRGRTSLRWSALTIEILGAALLYAILRTVGNALPFSLVVSTIFALLLVGLGVARIYGVYPKVIRNNTTSEHEPPLLSETEEDTTGKVASASRLFHLIGTKEIGLQGSENGIDLTYGTEILYHLSEDNHTAAVDFCRAVLYPYGVAVLGILILPQSVEGTIAEEAEKKEWIVSALQNSQVYPIPSGVKDTIDELTTHHIHFTSWLLAKEKTAQSNASVILFGLILLSPDKDVCCDLGMWPVVNVDIASLSNDTYDFIRILPPKPLRSV